MLAQSFSVFGLKEKTASPHTYNFHGNSPFHHECHLQEREGKVHKARKLSLKEATLVPHIDTSAAALIFFESRS